MAVLLLLVVFTVLTGALSEDMTVSASHSLVYGPGVDAKRAPMPIEYIYVQLKTKEGKNYTGSVSEDAIELSFTTSEGRAFVHKLTHYIGEGLFIVRYRLHRETKSLTITIKYDGEHVADSPYNLGTVLTDRCYCPYRTLDQWLSDFQCPHSYDQINANLAPFQNEGIKLEVIYNRLIREFSHTHGVHYSIIDNKLYGKTFGTITDFRFMSDFILTSLVNKAKLPNMELIVQVSDWPQDRNNHNTKPFPFFSWCGSEHFRDIIWPQYDLLRHTIQAMDRVTLDMVMLQEAFAVPWEERIPKAFFRGRDSNKVRLELVKKYRKQTDLFNVTMTQFFFFPYDKELYGEKVNRISFLEFFKYKYQINIDGTVAAYRFPFLMAGGSLIFKQDSEYYEHFYHQLEPWVHYVPMKQDISDIEERLQWAIEHDDEAKKIARNAHQFAKDNLLPDHLYCYMFTLLKEYAKLQRGTPKIHEGMTEVTTDDPEWTKSCSLCPHQVKDEL